MGDVTRYTLKANHVSEGVQQVPSENGQWVDYADYDALRRVAERLRHFAILSLTLFDDVEQEHRATYAVDGMDVRDAINQALAKAEAVLGKAE